MTSSGGSRRPRPTWAVPGADAQRRRLVGPGRLLRPAQGLRDVREARHRNGRTSWWSAPGTTAAGRTATGDRLGPVEFGSATAQAFPRQDPGPLVRGAISRTRARRAFPRPTTFRTGSNTWQTYDRWPPREATPSASTREGRQAGIRAAPRRSRTTPASTPISPTPTIPCPIVRGRSRRRIRARNGRSGWSRTSGSSTIAPTS